MRDTQTGALILASRADGPDGAPSPREASSVTISADGRRVAFLTEARLDPADPSDEASAYVRDLVTGRTYLASRADGADGAGANDDVSDLAISGDGNRVAFGGRATNLGDGDAAPNYDVHVRDLAAGTTTLATAGAGGAPGDGDAYAPVARRRRQPRRVRVLVGQPGRRRRRRHRGRARARPRRGHDGARERRSGRAQGRRDEQRPDDQLGRGGRRVHVGRVDPGPRRRAPRARPRPAPGHAHDRRPRRRRERSAGGQVRRWAVDQRRRPVGRVDEQRDQPRRGRRVAGRSGVRARPRRPHDAARVARRRRRRRAGGAWRVPPGAQRGRRVRRLQHAPRRSRPAPARTSCRSTCAR